MPPSQVSMSYGPLVVPILLSAESAQTMDWEPGQEYWVTVRFYEDPAGEPIYEEPAEKLWWFQQTPALMLGASGASLPPAWLRRGIAWIEVEEHGQVLTTKPITVHPRKSQIRMGGDSRHVQQVLGKMLPGVDASYLAQVSHFLAGNIAHLDVQGSTYNVSGYGQVINSAGEWTGEPISSGGGNGKAFETIQANQGSITAQSANDVLFIGGGGSANTTISGNSLTIEVTEQDGDPNNELQNVFTTVNGNSGSSTASSTSDALQIVGTGAVSTSISGNDLTISVNEEDGDATNELQNLFSTINADTGSKSAGTRNENLDVVGTGFVSTSIAGNTLTIEGTIGNLDFSQLNNQMTLDANTTVNMDTNTANLSFDQGTFAIDSSQNRVGIGTDFPTQKLHLAQGNFLTTPGKPEIVSRTPIFPNISSSVFPQSVIIQNNYAYICSSGSNQLVIFDMTNPLLPELISRTTIGGNGAELLDLKVAGRYAYILNGTSDFMYVYDVSNPKSPQFKGDYRRAGASVRIEISGQYAYILSPFLKKLQVLSIANPANPELVSSLTFSKTFYGLQVVGNRLYLSGSNNENLQILDISDPANPTSMGKSSVGMESYHVQVRGKYAYVPDLNGTLYIFDISNPTAPILASSPTLVDKTGAMTIAGDYLILADVDKFEIKVFDLKAPTSPVELGVIKLNANTEILGITAHGRYLYALDSEADELMILKIHGADISTMNVGNLQTGSLNVSQDLHTQGQLQVTGGAYIGPGGLYSDGNMGLSGTLSLANDMIPSQNIDGAVQLYSQDVASSAELRVRDEAGNVTTLSPHNFSLIGAPSEPLAWSFYSQRDDMTINVDMLRAIRVLEQLSGETLVQTEGYAPPTRETQKSLKATVAILETQNRQLQAELSSLKQKLGLVD